MKKRYNDFEDIMNVTIETGDAWLDKKLNSHICYGGKGGGGGSQQQDVPATLRPYVTKVLDRASDLYAAERPYQAYPGERVVGFSQPELAAQQGIAQQVLQRGIGATAPGLTSAGAFYNPAYGLLGQATGAQQMGGAMLGQVAPALGQAQQTLGGVQPALGMYGQSVGQAQQALGATAPTLGQFEQQLQQAAGTYGQAAEAARAATGPVDIGQLETQRFMDPYQQQVTDIAKREAIKEAQLYGQQLAAQAAQTGGFGGSRQALLEGQAASDLGGRLADIQAKGSQAAYQQALQTAAQQQQLGYGERTAQLQRQAGLSQALAGLGGSQAALGIQGYGGLAGAGRETAGQMAQLGSQYGQIGSQLGQLAGLQADIGGQYGGLAGQYGQQASGLGALSQAYGGLGQQALGQQYRELGYLSGVGEAQRGLEQQRADTAYQEFLQQRDYPSQQLQQFSSLIQGFPFQITQPAAAPSALQQGLGTAATIGGIGRGLGFFKEGGQIDGKKNNGLSGVVYAAVGGEIQELLDRKKEIEAEIAKRNEGRKRPSLNLSLTRQLADIDEKLSEFQQGPPSAPTTSVQERIRNRTGRNKQNTGLAAVVGGTTTQVDAPAQAAPQVPAQAASQVPAQAAAITPTQTSGGDYTQLLEEYSGRFGGDSRTVAGTKALETYEKLQELLKDKSFDKEARQAQIEEEIAAEKAQGGFDVAALGLQLMSTPAKDIDPALVRNLGTSKKQIAKLQNQIKNLPREEQEAAVKDVLTDLTALSTVQDLLPDAAESPAYTNNILEQAAEIASGGQGAAFTKSQFAKNGYKLGEIAVDVAEDVKAMNIKDENERDAVYQSLLQQKLKEIMGTIVVSSNTNTSVGSGGGSGIPVVVPPSQAQFRPDEG